MKLMISFIFTSLLVAGLYFFSCSDITNHDNVTVINDSNDQLEYCCCNTMDARTKNGCPVYLIYCSGREIMIDSQCCANVWNYFNGSPPENLDCTTVYLLCPETKNKNN